MTDSPQGKGGDDSPENADTIADLAPPTQAEQQAAREKAAHEGTESAQMAPQAPSDVETSARLDTETVDLRPQEHEIDQRDGLDDLSDEPIGGDPFATLVDNLPPPSEENNEGEAKDDPNETLLDAPTTTSGVIHSKTSPNHNKPGHDPSATPRTVAGTGVVAAGTPATPASLNTVAIAPDLEEAATIVAPPRVAPVKSESAPTEELADDTEPVLRDKNKAKAPAKAQAILADTHLAIAGAKRRKVEIQNRSDGGILYWVAKLYVFGAFVLVGLIGLAVIFGYSYFAQEAPPAPDLRNYASTVPAISQIVASDNTLLGEFADEWREVVPFDEIPQGLVDAVLATEDHNFFDHRGLYFKGIARALWRDISAGDFAQGGSTITQQVAKQFLSSEKSVMRKAKEAILARRLEETYSKKAILSVYLNHIYLGGGAYGVRMAARRYFDKKLEELTTAEMATIAGLAQAPSRYSPYSNPERALRRRNEVLDKMVLHGFLESADKDKAAQEPLQVVPRRDIFGDRSPYYTEHIRRYVNERYGSDALQKEGLRIEAAVDPVTDAIAYENIDYGARKQDKRQGWRGPVAHLEGGAREIFLSRAADMYGSKELEPARRYLALVEEVQTKACQVRIGDKSYELPLSNMDWASRWQREPATNDETITDAGSALRVGDVVWVKQDFIENLPFRQWFLSKGVNPHWVPEMTEERLAKKRADAEGKVVLEQVPHPQSALITGDHETGYVVAMVGGTDFDRSVYNRAYQSCRQPGSTYKPIYYSAALAEGYGFDTSLNDIPRAEIDPVTGEIWIPENFKGTVDNKVSLEYAMVFSKNVASVDVFKRVGADNVEAWARRLGFTTKIIADKALALGASCTKLHELTGAFARFARNGRSLQWKWVRRIFDREGNLLEDNTTYYDPMLRHSDRLDRLFVQAGQRAKQDIPARAGYLISKLLRQTIKSGFSSIVRNTKIISAGKTGTSSETMDNTFVSYTSRWITTIWMGDDVRARPLGDDDAAYMTVEPMWARYMKEAAEGHPNKEIPWVVPEGVDPNDRGDHSKGVTIQMPLVYIKSARKPEAD